LKLLLLLLLLLKLLLLLLPPNLPLLLSRVHPRGDAVVDADDAVDDVVDDDDEVDDAPLANVLEPSPVDLLELALDTLEALDEPVVDPLELSVRLARAVGRVVKRGEIGPKAARRDPGDAGWRPLSDGDHIERSRGPFLAPLPADLLPPPPPPSSTYRSESEQSSGGPAPSSLL
jgi:hypothetical protein